MTEKISWTDVLSAKQLSLTDFALLAMLTFFLAAFFVVRSREKRLLSLDSYFLLFFVVVPLYLFYPLSYSSANALATGLNQESLVPYLPKAFLISTIGVILLIFAVFLGKQWRRPTRVGAVFTRSVRCFWLSRAAVTLSAFLLFAAMSAFIGVGASFGSARSFALENRSISFLFNFYNEFAAFALFNAVFYCSLTRKRVDYLLAILIFVASLFLGTRASSLLTLLTALVGIAVAHRYTKLLRPIVVVLSLLAGAILLSLFRDSLAGSIDTPLVLASVFFGNNFSDVRDFAWLLSGWDGTLLVGSTYAAGLISFIPSTFFPLRNDWGWAAFSGAVSGLDPAVHPGLRPGLFGELYFNFGYFGVIGGALFAGALVGRYANRSERAATSKVLDAKSRMVEVYVCTFLVGLIPFMFFTAGLFGLYVKLALILLGLLIGQTGHTRSAPVKVALP